MWREWANNPLIFPPPPLPTHDNNGYDLTLVPPPPSGAATQHQHQHQQHHHHPHHHHHHHSALTHQRDDDANHLRGVDKEQFRNSHAFKEFNQNLYITRKKLRRYRKKHAKTQDGPPTAPAAHSNSNVFRKNSLNMENFMALQPPLNVTPAVIRT